MTGLSSLQQGAHAFDSTLNALAAASNAPPQIAGHKRSRQEFEPQRPQLAPMSRTRFTNRLYYPGEPRGYVEPYWAPDVPAVRGIKQVGRCAYTAASLLGAGALKVFKFIKDRYYTPTPRMQIPPQEILIVDFGHKRRALMPGSFPNTPIKNSNATLQSISSPGTHANHAASHKLPTDGSLATQSAGSSTQGPISTTQNVNDSQGRISLPNPTFSDDFLAIWGRNRACLNADIPGHHCEICNKETGSSGQDHQNPIKNIDSSGQDHQISEKTLQLSKDLASDAPKLIPFPGVIPTGRPRGFKDLAALSAVVATCAPPPKSGIRKKNGSNGNENGSKRSLLWPPTTNTVAAVINATASAINRPERSDAATVPTPPNSRPSSSWSNDPKIMAIAKPLGGPTEREGRAKQAALDKSKQQSTNLKSILKPSREASNDRRDKNVDDLIQRVKSVEVVTPETYRQRTVRERELSLAALRQNREANEELEKRLSQEAERVHDKRMARFEKERVEQEIKRTEQEIKDLTLMTRKAEYDRQLAEAAEQERLLAAATPLPLYTTDDVISTVPNDLDDRIAQAMAVKNPKHTIANSVDGAELCRKDFGTLLPQKGTSDDPSGWLNDEIVNGFVGAIVASKKEQANYQKGKGAPPYEAYPSGWLGTVESKGMEGIARWSKRKGIQGTALLNTERIFFPINSGSHWTLLIISAKERKIEYLDSLPSGARAKRFFSVARQWLAMELKGAYKAGEWTDHRESTSNKQNNSNDCGVFTCFNALANAKGLPYDLIDPERIPEARRLLAAVLMKGGFNAEMGVE